VPATLKLTVQQRLNIEGIIRQQRSPDDETLMINFELLKKIRIPAEEKQIYLRDIPTPQGIMTEFYNKTIQAALPADVTLETAEFRRLDSLLKDWKQYTTDDVEWLMDLKGQIARINNGVASSSKRQSEPKHDKASAN